MHIGDEEIKASNHMKLHASSETEHDKLFVLTC